MVEPNAYATVFKAAQVVGIGYNLQCSDHHTHAKLVKAQTAAATRLSSGYCKHVNRCSVSNSQVRYISGTYLPSNGGIFNFSLGIWTSSRT